MMMIDKEELLSLLIPLLVFIVLFITFAIKRRATRTDESKTSESEETVPDWLFPVLVGMDELSEKIKDEIKQLDGKLGQLARKVNTIQTNVLFLR